MFQIYLGESYVNANHKKQVQWISPEGKYRKTKSGKGGRWILLGKFGWLKY